MGLVHFLRNADHEKEKYNANFTKYPYQNHLLENLKHLMNGSGPINLELTDCFYRNRRVYNNI